MHNKQGRPTLRLLREDLTKGWTQPSAKRALDDGRLDDLMPLSELPHPIIQKARESFGNETVNDNYVGRIASATNIDLLEIKTSQWRGGVWIDPSEGVRWLVVAGLAKGNHQDSDDFYEVIARQNDSGGFERWIPQDEDLQLLNRETAARIRIRWELKVQRILTTALAQAVRDGQTRFEVSFPKYSERCLASVEISIESVREKEFIPCDEILVEFIPNRDNNFNEAIYWLLIQRVLTSLSPPVEGWDRFEDSFSNMEEPGGWGKRVRCLQERNEQEILESPLLSEVSHYAHRKHLAECVVEGRGTRSLCGKYFVPSQDPKKYPVCPECEEVYLQLPR